MRCLKKSAVLYRNVGTVPFTLQQTAGVEIDTGSTKANGMVVFNNSIYLRGSSRGRKHSLNVISGTSSQEIFPSNDLDSDSSLAFRLSTNGNDLMLFSSTPAEAGYVASFNATTGKTFFNNTESGAGSVTAGFPIRGIHEGANNEIYGVIVEVGSSTISLGTLVESQSLDSTYNYGTSILPFTYEFRFIQNSGEPVSIKSISMSFSGVATAELLSSIDGETFTSLGSFDLSSKANGAKVAEWRRINRYFSQVMFKLSLTSDSNERIAILNGGVAV